MFYLEKQNNQTFEKAIGSPHLTPCWVILASWWRISFVTKGELYNVNQIPLIMLYAILIWQIVRTYEIQVAWQHWHTFLCLWIMTTSSLVVINRITQYIKYGKSLFKAYFASKAKVMFMQVSCSKISWF